MRLPPYARNPIRLGDDGAVAYVGLSCGQETIIDVADLARVALYRWRACWRRDTGRYSVTGQRDYLSHLPITVTLHRFILDAAPDQIVKHVDRDMLNNRRANLRVVMMSEHARRRRSQPGGFTWNLPLVVSHEGLGEFDRGYIAGIIISEGCFGGDKRDARLIVRLHERDPEPLLHLQRCLGGRLYGPYTHNGRHLLDWQLRGPALRQRLAFFDELLPPSHKRDQYFAWKIKYGLTTGEP